MTYLKRSSHGEAAQGDIITIPIPVPETSQSEEGKLGVLPQPPSMSCHGEQIPHRTI